MEQSRDNGGTGYDDTIGDGEGGKEEFMKRVPRVAAVVVDEAKDLMGNRVEEEVGDDF